MPEQPGVIEAVPRSWVQRFLGAQATWVTQRLSGCERALWLCADPYAGPVGTQEEILKVFCKGDRLQGDVVATNDAWPIQDDALDAILLQHPLEIGLDLETVLLEAVRVLKPEASLWILTSGIASAGRFRLASALNTSGSRWSSALRPNSLHALLIRLGCVDVERASLEWDRRNDRFGELTARALPWSSLILVHARKRRSAHILRPRMRNRSSSAPLPGLPAIPASRIGLTGLLHRDAGIGCDSLDVKRGHHPPWVDALSPTPSPLKGPPGAPQQRLDMLAMDQHEKCGLAA